MVQENFEYLLLFLRVRRVTIRTKEEEIYRGGLVVSGGDLRQLGYSCVRLWDSVEECMGVAAARVVVLGW